jgi:ABC-type nickel/cobalt efflux system permease component RcnA
MDERACRVFLFDWFVAAMCGVEPEERCTEHSVGKEDAARENRSGAVGGLQGSGWLVLLSLASILELMLFGATASYVMSLNVHIVVMLRALLVHLQVRLHLLLACFD